MASIEAFKKNGYIFAPDLLAKNLPMPHAVGIMAGGILILDFNGKTRAEADAYFVRFSEIFGAMDYNLAVECPRGGGCTLKITYPDAANKLTILHDKGLLGDHDFAQATIRCARFAPPKQRADRDAPLSMQVSSADTFEAHIARGNL